MALSLPHDTWLRLAVWTVIGVVVYFAYGRKHSRLVQARAAAAPGRK